MATIDIDYLQKMAKDKKKQYAKLLKSIDTTSLEYASSQAAALKKIIESSYDIAVQSILKTQKEQQLEYAKYIKQQVDSYNRSLKDAPKIKDVILQLIDMGWYPDINNFGISAFLSIKKDVLTLSESEINEAFEDYFASNLETITEYIVSQYPHREKHIIEAIKLHKQENYMASIPLLLIQIDGCAYDISKNYYFMTDSRKKTPNIGKVIKEMEDYTDFTLALLAPLQSPQPLTYGFKERDKKFHKFNRHQIIHGEILNYDTKVNSYKSISLLYYIVQAGEIVKDYKKVTKK